jgi:hypothetical protein
VPAESSALDCSNDSDDDGDFKKDCFDPDCWGFARCGLIADASVPMPPFVPPPTGVPALPDEPLEPPIGKPDGSVHTPWMPDAGIADSGVDAETDAEPPLLCSEYCPEGECDDGVCNVPLELGEFEITRIDLLIPREQSEGVCFDEPGKCTSFELLCCPPDPFVIVRVGDKKAGVVGSPNSALKAWDAPGIRMRLREGDELTFEVVDDDNEAVGDGPDAGVAQPVFTCTTNVTLGKALDRRTLGCTPDNEDRPASDVLTRYGITATIEQISRRAP